MVARMGCTAWVPDRGLYVGSYRRQPVPQLAQLTPGEKWILPWQPEKASGRTRYDLRAGAQEAVDLDLGPVPILFGTPSLEITLYR